MHIHKYGQWSKPEPRTLLGGTTRLIQYKTCSQCNKTLARWVIAR